MLRPTHTAEERIVFFDLETTGFNIFHNEIIEIAAVDNFGNTFETLVSVDKGVPKKITEITSITPEMVMGKPPCDEALTQFKSYLHGQTKTLQFPDSVKRRTASYLIGHNALAFDIPFVEAHSKKHNIKCIPSSARIIDTMRVSQFILPNQYSHSLAALSERFGHDQKNAHRALSDVIATRHVYDQLCILYKRHYPSVSPSLLHRLTTM